MQFSAETSLFSAGVGQYLSHLRCTISFVIPADSNAVHQNCGINRWQKPYLARRMGMVGSVSVQTEALPDVALPRRKNESVSILRNHRKDKPAIR